MNELPFPLSDAKIAPGSLLTEADQVALYAAEKGVETTTRQVRLGRLAQRKCVCTPSKVKKRWQNMDRPTTRTIHKPDCPRFQSWMAEP